MKNILIKSTYLIIFILLQSCNSNSKSLMKKKFVECDVIGLKSRPSNIYKKYLKYKEESNIQYLIKYSKSENLIERTYASWALMEKGNPDSLKQLSELLEDNNEITQSCGCTYGRIKISTSSYLNYLSTVPFNENEYPFSFDYKLSIMDSLILFQEPINNDLLDIAMNNREFKSKEMIERIIYLTFNKKNEIAGNYIKAKLENKSLEKYKNKIVILANKNPNLKISRYLNK